jgi:bifunctional non-homologous end joining protein LigD
MPLEEYRKKRRFTETPEPEGKQGPAGAQALRFVVQKHAATRLHYDFRLEVDGVLKSWAVPKGPSALPRDKRLAVMTEDHPLDYGDFEGVIPGGNYGAGRVIVWDNGTYAPVKDKTDEPVEDPAAADALMQKYLAKGELKFQMRGEKLRGRYALINTGKRTGENTWLLIKDRDEHARDESGLPGDDRSVLSGRTLETVDQPPSLVEPGEQGAALEAVLGATKDFVLELSSGNVKLTNLDKVFWPAHEGRRPLTKRDFIAYHIRMAEHFLRHIEDRPLTLTRYPNGATASAFYQKDRPKGTPAYVESVSVYSGHRGETIDYLLVRNLAGLVWLAQTAALEIHPWISRITPTEPGDADLGQDFASSRKALDASALNYPDFLLFDIDPYVYSGKEKKGAEPELHRQGYELGVEGAFILKSMLDEVSLPSFVKTSGKTGLHIHVPIKRAFTYHEVRAIVETFVERMVRQHPQKFTTEWAVEKRRGKIFLDKNMVVRGKNMAAAYCPRPNLDAGVSTPLTWKALETAYPTDFTLETVPDIVAADGDPWAGILAAKCDLAAVLAG